MRTGEAPPVLILAQAAGDMIAELAAAAGPCAIFGTFHQRPRPVLPPAVTVHAAPPLCVTSTVGRLWSWFLYLLLAAVWVVRQPRSAHIVLFSNPPLLPVLGYLLRKLTGRRYTVVVYDIYPDLLVRIGKLREKGASARLWRAANRLAYGNAERVITLGPCLAENLARQTAAPVVVIPPWVDTAAIRPVPKQQNPFAREHGQGGKLTVMYSGKMGISHDVETMLAAADRLREVASVHFMFIGGGPKWDAVRRQAQGLSNVTVLPWQSNEVLPYSIATADIAVVSLEAVASGLEFPSRTVFAMAAGAAILAVSRRPNDLERLVTEHGCGFCVDPGDVGAFVRVVERCLEHPEELEKRRQAARRAAEGKYSREINVAEMVRLACVTTQPGYAAKRVLDALGAAAGLLVLSPVMVSVATAIRLTMGAPVLFRQVRPGLDARLFTLIKFRTMTHAVDGEGKPLADSQRLTRLGRFLRRTSLDELPEFWNVLRGDMSLVGPRPLLMEYLPRYTVEQRQRHLVKPGITGLAQIRGRQDITFSQRIELDNWYVHNCSLWLDLSILVKTVAQVIAGSGVRPGQDVSIVDDLNAPANNGHASTPFDHTTS